MYRSKDKEWNIKLDNEVFHILEPPSYIDISENRDNATVVSILMS